MCQVRVLYSKERPVCVTMRGDDAAEYRYLVKSGDDTRTDQRVQQLFTVINSSLAADVRTGDRRLAIRTYKVLPLKPTLGLIEWVDNTETLREFLASASDRFGEQSEAACRLQVDQMQHRCGLRAAAPLLHGPYLVTADRQSVVDDFRRRQATLPAGLLREALLRLSRGPDTFLRLRTNATVSLALQAAAGWLLGVGDRHLKNFLVSLDDGVVIAIDFGHAFGSATHLPVPEVVPFRLTPQLASVADPLGTSGVIQQTMVRTLQALRSSHQLLAATLEVFVREPTIDWTKRARKDIATHDADAVLRWSRQCVRLARGRLQGAHPSADLCQLLRTSDLPQRQRDAWITAVGGRSGLDRRADLPDRHLTVQQQVTCLLDLATDPYILGLTWTRWEAHV